MQTNYNDLTELFLEAYLYIDRFLNEHLPEQKKILDNKNSEMMKGIQDTIKKMDSAINKLKEKEARILELYDEISFFKNEIEKHKDLLIPQKVNEEEIKNLKNKIKELQEKNSDSKEFDNSKVTVLKKIVRYENKNHILLVFSGVPDYETVKYLSSQNYSYYWDEELEVEGWCSADNDKVANIAAGKILEKYEKNQKKICTDNKSDENNELLIKKEQISNIEESNIQFTKDVEKRINGICPNTECGKSFMYFENRYIIKCAHCKTLFTNNNGVLEKIKKPKNIDNQEKKPSEKLVLYLLSRMRKSDNYYTVEDLLDNDRYHHLGRDFWAQITKNTNYFTILNAGDNSFLINDLEN